MSKIKNLKTLFESLEIDVEESKLDDFIKKHEELIESKIKLKTDELKGKVESYQKRNNELSLKLEESKNINAKIDNIIDKKIKTFESVDIADIQKKLDLVDKKIAENVLKFEKIGNKVEKIVKESKDNNITQDISQDINKIKKLGNVFENYITQLAETVVKQESNTITKLKEIVEKMSIEIKERDILIEKLNDDLQREKEMNRILSIIENHGISEEDKEIIIKLYESGGKDSIDTIENYVMSKSKLNERKYSTPPNEGKRIIKNENMGLLRKKNINEGHRSEMSGWVELAQIN